MNFKKYKNKKINYFFSNYILKNAYPSQEKLIELSQTIHEKRIKIIMWFKT